MTTAMWFYIYKETDDYTDGRRNGRPVPTEATSGSLTLNG